MAWFLALGSYLLGSIPFGLLLARTRGVEIRRMGSGNIGATNVARSLGPAEGVLTLVCDAGKGFLPTFLAVALGLSAGWIGAVALLATLGHIFPLWLRFRGGKGVATGWGAFLAAAPWAALASAGVFALTFALSRRVSPASLLSAFSLPFLVLALGGPPPLAWAAGLSALLVILRHRENLRRLFTGQESRFNLSGRS